MSPHNFYTFTINTRATQSPEKSNFVHEQIANARKILNSNKYKLELGWGQP